MRLDPNRQAAAVAVFLVLILGVITATYMTLFPPRPPNVSCTSATACAAPDKPRPDPPPDDYDIDG
jgi:hypothetical protein